MPTTILVGTKGTLKFEASMAGFDPDQVTDVKWSQQGSPQHVKFTQPDKVEGISAGTGDFKCTVTQKPEGGGQPQKSVYNFVVECTDPAVLAVPKMVPVSITPVLEPPPPPERIVPPLPGGSDVVGMAR